MWARHVSENSAERGTTIDSICRVVSVKIRRQTVRARVSPPISLQSRAHRDFRFSNFVYATFVLGNLFAVTLTVTAFIPVSIKGVSQGGSAARFAGAKNAACSEWRTRASDR